MLSAELAVFHATGKRFSIGVTDHPLDWAIVFCVFNMRDRGSQLFRNEITTNKYIWGALLVCMALLLLVVYVSPLASVLQLKHPGLDGWGLILGTSLVPLILGQLVKSVQSASLRSHKSL